MGTPNLSPIVFESTLTCESRMNSHHSTVSTSSLISTAVSRWRRSRLSEMVMTMQLAHGMPRGSFLFLLFNNSMLEVNPSRQRMPWQVNTLPICQSGSHWQSCGVSASDYANPCSFSRLYNVRSLIPICLANSLREPLKVASACTSVLPPKGVDVED